MKLRLSIKTRLTASYLLVVALLLAFFGCVAYFTLSRSLYAKTLYPWDMRLATIERFSDGSSNVTGIANLLPDEINDPAQGTLIITHQISAEEISSGQPLKFSVPAGELSIDPSLIITSDRALSGKEIWLRLYVSPNNPRDYQLLVIQQSTADAAIWLSAFRRMLLVVSAITLAIAGVLGFFLVRQMLRPVQKMTRAAQQIQDTNLSLRLEVHGQDELARLGMTLNHMFERLEKAFEREKEFTADASHELRTPLSVIQGEVSLAPYGEMAGEDCRRSLETIGRQASRMSATIERMMFLASLDQTPDSTVEPVSVTALLSAIVEDVKVISSPKGIDLTFQSHQDAVVSGDAARLRVLFLNLLENAVKYTPQGGKIKVRLDNQEGQATVSVADTGIGIKADQLPLIFQRFYRVDRSRSRPEGGDGLGLAIAQRIAELHGGKIVARSTPGKGSAFTVLLPLRR